MIKLIGKSNLKEEQDLIDLNNTIFEQKSAVGSTEINDDGEYLSHLSNCLVTLVPVTSNEPFQLFGSKNKSLVANKLSVHQALYNKNNIKEVKAGKLILEMIISDEMLSHAMITMDSSATPATFRNIGNNIIDPATTLKSKNSVTNAESSLEESVDELITMFENARLELICEMQKNKPLKKQIASALRALECSINNLKANAQYSVDTLANNLTKDVNSVKSEFLSTIEKLSFYKNKSQLLLPQQDCDINDQYDFLYWFANGEFKQFDVEKYISLIKKIKNPKPETEKYLTTLENKFYKVRDGFNLSHGSFSMSSVFGASKLCNTQNIDLRFIELRFANGYEHYRYSTTFDNDNEFLRIAISMQDILFLLRGTHNTDFVIGTINRYAQTAVPMVKIKEFNQDVISKKENIGANKNVVLEQFSKVADISNGSLKKEERLQAQEEIKKLEELFSLYAKDCLNTGAIAQEDIENEFKEKLQSSLNKELLTIDNHLVEKTLTLFEDKK